MCMCVLVWTRRNAELADSVTEKKSTACVAVGTRNTVGGGGIHLKYLNGLACTPTDDTVTLYARDDGGGGGGDDIGPTNNAPRARPGADGDGPEVVWPALARTWHAFFLGEGRRCSGKSRETYRDKSFGASCGAFST